MTKKNFVFLFSIFFTIFLAFIIFKTHDDFGYYHFPYSYYLNKFSMIIGVGPLNHGFKTPSSIFYLNSLFYLPYLDYYLYHLSAILIFGFSNIVLISNIKKNLDTVKKIWIIFTYWRIWSPPEPGILIYGAWGSQRSARKSLDLMESAKGTLQATSTFCSIAYCWKTKHVQRSKGWNSC